MTYETQTTAQNLRRGVKGNFRNRVELAFYSLMDNDTNNIELVLTYDSLAVMVGRMLLDGELDWDKLEGAHWKQKHARRMVNSVNARKQAEATEQDIIDAVAGINFEKGGRYTNTEIKQALTDALAELGLEDLTVNAGILRKAFVISPTMITVNEYGERENGYIIRGRVDGADMEEAAPQEPVAELKTVEAQLCEDEELMAMVSSMSDAFDVPLLDPIW